MLHVPFPEAHFPPISLANRTYSLLRWHFHRQFELLALFDRDKLGVARASSHELIGPLATGSICANDVQRSSIQRRKTPAKEAPGNTFYSGGCYVQPLHLLYACSAAELTFRLLVAAQANILLSFGVKFLHARHWPTFNNGRLCWAAARAHSNIQVLEFGGDLLPVLPRRVTVGHIRAYWRA